MFTKIIVCSVALGGLATLSGMFERAQTQPDPLAQMPGCGGSEVQCQGSPVAKASASQFFAMLATH